MAFISRSSSGLADPVGDARKRTSSQNRTGFVVHWDGGETPRTSARSFELLKVYDRYHRQLGWGGLGYNLAVDPVSGNIYEGRGIDNIGAHAGGANTANIGCILIGGPGNLTEAGKHGLREAYERACAHTGRQLDQLVHSDINQTDCPGDEIRRWVHVGGLGGDSSKLDVDGEWGPLTTKALQRELGVAVDGELGPETTKALQARLGVTVDGIIGTETRTALQRRLGVEADGFWGPVTVRALQNQLNRGGFS